MNPYRELAQIIESWEPGQSALSGVRLRQIDGGRNRWSGFRRAVELLAEIEDDLAEDVSIDEVVEAAWQFLVQPNVVWKQSPGQPFPEAELRNLKLMGRLWEHESAPLPPPPPLSEDARQSLKASLEQIREGVDALTIDGESVDQLRALIDEALRALDDDDLTEEEARSRAQQVAGAALVVSSKVEDEAERKSFGASLWGVLKYLGAYGAGVSQSIVASVITNALPS